MAIQSKKQPLLPPPPPSPPAPRRRPRSARMPQAAWRWSPISNINSSKCPASSVTVSQTNTGAKAGYDPVFEVAVHNGCGRCAVRGVVLRSEGFASSVAVDPRLFRREGRDYLVGDGRRIEPGAEVRFRYAWDRAFRMATAAVQDDCS
ncbi:hypothetical protein U9M48_002792 [Paspalum notatum var. saurae]|uniref:Uncharacterized protein n=1 Tax=Paspalum notatum var. saurae TaxID=547442 RepID=A0AAQ3SGE7_PASNO